MGTHKQKDLESRSGRDGILKELKRIQSFSDNLKKGFSNLYNALTDELRPMTRLTIKTKGDEYLGVLTRWDEDKSYVLFAGSPDPIGVLYELDKAIAADRWKEDKYDG
jgi:hypothetical protein